MTVDAPPHRAQAQELAVETRGLRKTYRTRKGRSVAVAGLDLKVPRGGVHGFLGPNGSGKTTTIRMLLGLITADSGEMAVLGRPVPQHLPEVIGSIGAIVEQPKFFPAFSGRRNLQLLAQAIGAPTPRVDEVLNEVGLGGRGKDRFRSYSLGMRQRLAIAATLLKDPELLIFDEPTNGLDPAGIHEIRATMRNLADSGRTVLVSSHILTEVQQVADTVSIIGRGRLLAEGDVAEILARGARETVRVRVPDPARAAQLLGAAGFAVQPGPDVTLVVTPPALPDGGAARPFDAAAITEVLARQEIFVSELVPQRADLEQVFLALTAEEHLGAAGPPPPQSPPEVLATSARPSGAPGADR
jgi:ABC-type multidrug transport system ATPase subunit